MTKTDWGTKRACPKCAARFYDLGKNPAHCPKCGTEHDVTAIAKPRRGRGKAVVQTIAADAKEKAKLDAKLKAKKPVKEIEDIDLEEFEDIETLDTEEEIEELEEIEDIETLDELEKADDGKPGDENNDEIDVVDETLIDDVDEEELEEEDEPASKRPAKNDKKK